MSKKTKISNRIDIAKLHMSKFRFSCPQFLVSCVRNHLDHVRYCISVSKKVSKKAVTRNKIKRQIRTFFDSYIKSTKPTDSSVDFYISIRKPFLENDYTSNSIIFKYALKKVVAKLMM